MVLEIEGSPSAAHGSGDAQARRQTCGQIPSTDVLLRGGADGIRALSADQEAWPRLHRGGALADPEETWRSGEDEPTRCGRPSQAIAGRGTPRGLGARRAGWGACGLSPPRWGRAERP